MMRCGLIAVAAVLVGSVCGAKTLRAEDAPATRAASRPVDLGRIGGIDGVGVNIHFTDPRPGEMEMLAAGGFKWVRMDFAWAGTERKSGQYDFSAYDRLLAACDRQGIRAVFILDYSNRLYDDGLSPRSDEGRAAFARWAAAAARHFAGRGVVWEMYNEPNIGFWKPRPDPEAYAKLALAVGKSLREAAPDAVYIGPATSLIDLPFLETCFAAGLLDYWSAVSVHPYRQTAPETVNPEYRKLRQLIHQYAPKGKDAPIISGEWGYSTAWKGFDPERQGKFLARQWLTNFYNHVPISIWYDWHDDGKDPKEAEHHFGTVEHEYRETRENNKTVYELKPAYAAAKALTAALAGFHYNKRLAVGDPEQDYVLLFSKGDDPASARDVKLAVWTTADAPRRLEIPASDGAFQAVDWQGKPLRELAAEGEQLKVEASDGPRYLTPTQPNDILRVAAALERAPLETVTAGGRTTFISLEARNPLDAPIHAIGSTTGLFEPHIFPIAPAAKEVIPCRAYLTRDPEPAPLPVEIEYRDMAIITQWTQVVPTNPMHVAPVVAGGAPLALRIEAPGKEGFEGTLFLSDMGEGQAAPRRRIDIPAGQEQTLVRVPLPIIEAAPLAFSLRIEDRDHTIALKLPRTTYRPVARFARSATRPTSGGFTAVADGDARVKAQVSLDTAPPPAGPPAPEVPMMGVKYHFEPGHRFLRLAPAGGEAAPIEGKPRQLALWVHGDGQGNHIRMRYSDATGQIFQPDAGRMTWTGWRLVAFPLDGSGGRWGGANDGAVHYPIKLDTLLLIDAPGGKATGGTIHVAAPVFIE